jgi:hypothetical protein
MRSEGSQARAALGDSGGILPWISVGALAFGVRLIRLDHFSFWLDEILETFTIRDSWTGLWRSLRWQALHAPLDYALRKVVEVGDPSDAVRRLPGVAWGSASVALLGALVARRAGRAAGLSTAFLLALAPYHVRYSQEVRPYALGLLVLCCSLFFLESYLASGQGRDLSLLYLSCLATIYTLYLAGAILVMAGTSLLVEDAFDGDSTRRLRARRFLRWSPAFIGAVVAGYLPWLAVLLKALRQPAMTAAPAWSPRRVGRFISYFGFGPRDAYPLGFPEIAFAALLVGGVLVARRTPRLRFLVIWGIGGVAFLEFLEHRHPTYDSIFHWLPAGLGLTALAGIALGRALVSRAPSSVKLGLVIPLLGIDLRSLSIYFQQGRPDWRPIARFLSDTPSSERIFVENQYTQLCLGYYLVGPDWLCWKKATQREIANLDGELHRLLAAWDRNRDAWLVLAAGPRSPTLRSWSSPFPSITFPSAEGEGAIVRRLAAGR